jgi:hypothetical protein
MSGVFKMRKFCTELLSKLYVRVDSFFCYLLFCAKVSAMLLSNRQYFLFLLRTLISKFAQSMYACRPIAY